MRQEEGETGGLRARLVSFFPESIPVRNLLLCICLYLLIGFVAGFYVAQTGFKCLMCPRVTLNS